MIGMSLGIGLVAAFSHVFRDYPAKKSRKKIVFNPDRLYSLCPRNRDFKDDVGGLLTTIADHVIIITSIIRS